MRYFYKNLWSQCSQNEYWNRITAAQDNWRNSIINWFYRNYPTTYVDHQSMDIVLSESYVEQIQLERLKVYELQNYRDTIGVRSASADSCALICLPEAVDILPNIVGVCEELRPEVFIFRVFPPTGDKVGVCTDWVALFSRLNAAGYVVFDPNGDNLAIEDNYLHSSTLYALAVKGSAVDGDLSGFSARYRNELNLDGTKTVLEPDFLHFSAEVVSLKTAALATGAEYFSESSPYEVFEINQRKIISSSNLIELAQFDSALVLPRPGWKVFAGDKYYIEEIGPSDWSGLYRISHWRSLDGFWGINDSSPVVESTDIPDGSFLLGGDPAYYHWIFNYLPRLKSTALLKNMPDSSNCLPILTSDRIPERLLEIIPKLIDFPYKIIRLSSQAIYKTKRLYVPSFYSSHKACCDVSEFYKNKLNISHVRGTKKIYISRTDARDSSIPRRKVHNEMEVIEFLSRYGFEPVLLGDASVDEQIRIFSEASFVIGSHGAAFANMVFSPSGTKAIIFENSWNHTFMKDVLITNRIDAQTMLCEDIYDTTYEKEAIDRGESADEVRRSRNMIVDLGNLGSLLSEMSGHSL